MEYVVIISAIVSIALVFISKVYGISIVYPSLMIVLTIVIDVLSNTIRSRKAKKNINIDEYIKK